MSDGSQIPNASNALNHVHTISVILKSGRAFFSVNILYQSESQYLKGAILFDNLFHCISLGSPVQKQSRPNQTE